MQSRIVCALALLTFGTAFANAQDFPAWKEAPSGTATPYAPAAATYYPVPPTVMYPRHPAPGYFPPAPRPAYYGQPYYMPAPPVNPGFGAPMQHPYLPTGLVQKLPGIPASAPVSTTPPSQQSVAPTSPYMPESDPSGPILPPDIEHANFSDRLPDIYTPHRETCWVAVDYLAAWLRPSPLAAPLLSTAATPSPAAGVVGQRGTVILFGGDEIDYRLTSGIRGEVGLWLDDDGCYSLDLSGFFLPEDRVRFSAASDAGGAPVLVRPVTDANLAQEAGFLVSAPGVAAGNTDIAADIEFFGAELNGRCHVACSRKLSADALLGFRFLSLDESLTVTDRVRPLVANRFTFGGALINVGDELVDTDSFATSNRFYGFQLGGQLRWDLGRFNLGHFGETGRVFVGLFGKVAFGVTDQTVNINGGTTLISPTTGVQALPGGILALPSNIGDHSRSVFGIVPEFGINIAMNLTDHWRFRTGYTFLLWDGVARPGSHIDRAVNPAQVPSDLNFGTTGGANRPGFSFREDVFWMHQLNIGIEFVH